MNSSLVKVQFFRVSEDVSTQKQSHPRVLCASLFYGHNCHIFTALNMTLNKITDDWLFDMSIKNANSKLSIKKIHLLGGVLKLSWG